MIKTVEELVQAQCNACEEIKHYDCRILVCSGTGCIATGSHNIYDIFSKLVKETEGVELVFPAAVTTMKRQWVLRKPAARVSVSWAPWFGFRRVTGSFSM